MKQPNIIGTAVKKTVLAIVLVLALLITATSSESKFPKLAVAQTSVTITIKDDGSIEGADQIQRGENIYTLTGNISGTIQVQKSHIVIDGAGYSIEGNSEVGRSGIDLSNGRGQDPSRPEINNVTVKNLKILDFYYGVDNANTNNNTFFGNYIEDCESSFWIIGSFNNNLTGNTVVNASIAINYAGSNVITKNSFIDCWVTVWLSTLPMVDGNYWSDYKTRYPHAREIDETGIWDTPYEYWDNLTDNHPRVLPISYPLDGNTGIPNEENQTTLVVAISMAVVLAVAGLLVYFKKRKLK